MALSESSRAQTNAPFGAALRIDAQTSADIAGGLMLSDAAGWNQTADDWALFIERGHALGCRDDAGRLVATAAVLPYGAAAGWISMVLVAEGWRQRGLASALMRECIRHLQERGALPLLDATPDGAAVYKRLGFAAGFAFERWQSSSPLRTLNADLVPRRADARDLDRIAAFDQAATRLDRRVLLESLLARADTRAWLAADGRGFLIARSGRRATQIGPLVASSDEQAIALLGTALQEAPARTVFVDVPVARDKIAAWLEAQGFQRQRSFVRMSLGAARVPVADATVFTLAGPEFG
jgi:GNAT superfamily N-acetyltransferase